MTRARFIHFLPMGQIPSTEGTISKTFRQSGLRGLE
jgi:hypothetical protein